MNVVTVEQPTARTSRFLILLMSIVVGITAWLAIATMGAAGAVALIGWVGMVLVAAAVDARSARLPDALVVPGIGFVLASSIVTGQVLGAVGGGLLLCLPILVVHLARPEGMGFGDVKFGVLLGAGIGLVAVPLVLVAYLLAAVAHATVCVAVRAKGRLVPFGPALVAGSIAVVVAELIRRL